MPQKPVRDLILIRFSLYYNNTLTLHVFYYTRSLKQQSTGRYFSPPYKYAIYISLYSFSLMLCDYNGERIYGLLSSWRALYTFTTPKRSVNRNPTDTIGVTNALGEFSLYYEYRNTHILDIN